MEKKLKLNLEDLQVDYSRQLVAGSGPVRERSQ